MTVYGTKKYSSRPPVQRLLLVASIYIEVVSILHMPIAYITRC